MGEWFDPEDLSNFEPLPVRELSGKMILTDGHTRALAAYLAGLSEVPVAFDADEDLDMEAYAVCVKACEARGITSIADLEHRVLGPEEYRDKWDNWCDGMQEALAYLRR
ncbi:MAG: ParB/RepB/Spo0J family partition protein [Oscillospiraceae bacterium]